MSKERTLYVITGIDGAYLYKVTQSKSGVWLPDLHNSAHLERESGKGGIITAEYGRDPEKAKTFQSRKLAENYMKKYPVLRFCSIMNKRNKDN